MAAVAAVVVAFVPVWWCGWAWLRVTRGEGFEGALACRKVAEALGSASMVLLGLALLPTARRSFVLKALGVPYERSVAMHSAAATGMTACAVLHGLAFLALSRGGTRLLLRFVLRLALASALRLLLTFTLFFMMRSASL